jgi:signal transduction histidine kinase
MRADGGPRGWEDAGMTEERVMRLLPPALLVLATAVATAVAPALGDAAADVRLTLSLSLVTLLWTWFTPAGPTHWVVRSLLAFVLCWLNPLYAIFGFVGFLDLFETFPGRVQWVGLALVSATQAGAQAGGLPPEETWQWIGFGALLAVNFGVGGGFAKMSERTERRALELARVNAELEQAIAANAVLHEQLVAQARDAGVREERQRLAREIHDTIAQHLAGIVTQLEASVGGTRHDRALALAREALAEARRSVLDLSPSSLDGVSLDAALRSVVDAWGERHGVRAGLVVAGEPEPLHPEVEATVLRIAQESLSNVAKHAAASRVGVTLVYDGDEVVLDVRDDGVGFDPARPAGHSSFGLRGMRQRAERLAGTLVVESRAEAGTAVSVRLPALAREAA